ncbi:SMC5-SMC6 complex localization factor protein 1 isoform X1 [Lampetra planeri]
MALPPAQFRNFQISGFVWTMKVKLEKLILKLEGRLLPDKVFDTDCTHMIIAKPNYSEKYLSACAAGVWILREDYLRKSASAGFWLEESFYEWGNSGGATSDFELVARDWRRHIQSGGSSGAFQGWKVVLDISDMSRLLTFCRILKAGKAVVYEGSPSTSDAVVTHVLNDINCDTNPLESSRFDVPHYSVKYIADYLRQGPSKAGSESKHCSMFSNPPAFTHCLGPASAGSEQNHLSSQTCAVDPGNEMRTIIQNVLSTSNKSSYVSITSGYVRIHPISFSEGKQWLLDELTAKKMESLVECGFYFEALQEVEGYLTRSPLYCPPAGTLQNILKHILKKNDKKLMEQFCRIFDLLLAIYPPWVHWQFSDYYLWLLRMPDDTEDCEGCWALLKTLISTCVNGDDRTRQKQQVYSQLLVCFCKLFEAELFELNTSRATERGSHGLRPNRSSVLVQVFCIYSGSVTLAPNKFDFFMVQLRSACCRRTPQQDNNSVCATRQEEYQLLRLVQCLLGVVLEFSLLWNRGRAMEDIQKHANQMAIECSDFPQPALETLVTSLTSPWLRMHMCDMLLWHMFVQNKSEVMKMPISLSKIKTAYFCIKRFSAERVSQQQGRCYSATGEVDNLSLYDGLVGRLRKQSKETDVNTLETIDGDVLSSACKSINPKGETRLHKACIKNDVAKLKQLLEIPGTDINVQDCAGWTPLHDACFHGSLECVREILQSCQSVDLHAAVDGRTPMSEALARGHGDVASLLLQHGAERNQDTDNSLSSCANPAVFVFLLKQLLQDYLRLHHVLELLQTLWLPGDCTEGLRALRTIATDGSPKPWSPTEMDKEVERCAEDLVQVMALHEHVPALKAFLTEVVAPEPLSAKTEGLLRALDCDASLPRFLGYTAQ